MVKLTANVMTEEHQGFIVLAFLFFFSFCNTIGCMNGFVAQI